MNISISKEEYEAVYFASNQIEADIEAADDDYADEASKHLNALYIIQQKYKRACAKENILRNVQKIVAKENSESSRHYIEKIARGLVRKITEENK